MALGENVVYAHWPQSFRVTVWINNPTGGLRDVGVYPLLCPTTDNNHSWAWLTDQLVDFGVLSTTEAFESVIEVRNGRTMVLRRGPEGEQFMLLMPS